MIIYFLIALILLWLGFAEIFARNFIWGALGSACLIVFAGLRYRTGWDWLAYEQYFAEMYGITEIVEKGLPETTLSVEPLFMAFTTILKTFTDGFVFIFLSISIFSISTIWYVAHEISKRAAAVWLGYFGIAFLVGQMTLMRQSIASSFVLLAILMAIRFKKFAQYLFIVIAMGFQLSSILFLPILFLCRKRPPAVFAIAFILTGFILLVNNITLENYVFRAASFISPEWIGSKLAFAKSVDGPVSMGALGLIFLQTTFLAVFYLLPKNEEKRNSFIIVAIWLTLLLLMAHLYLFGHPSFWNRIMLVALPWQIATLFTINRVLTTTLIGQLSILIMFSLISNAALLFSLNKPESLPFIPYHSALQVWLFGDEGTGKERLEFSINNF